MSKTNTGAQLKKGILCYFLPIVFICVLVSQFVFYGTSLRIVGDEFGYWNAAAYFTGLDWSDVASINHYYSFGYALLLAPILKIPVAPVTRYMLAQILNITLLCCVFLMVTYVIKKLVSLSDYIISLIALAVTLYPANTTYTLYNLTESLILFLFWAILSLLVSCIGFSNEESARTVPGGRFYGDGSGVNFLPQNRPPFKLYLAAVLAVYSFTVHQRTIIVTVVSYLAIMAVIFFTEDKKAKVRDFIIVTALMAGLFALASLIKSDFQANYLSISDNSAIVNDFGYEASKLGWLGSARGIKRFFASAFGKLFYLLSTTYLFFGIIIIDFFKDIASIIKEKSLKGFTLIRLFISTCLLASLGLETISLLGYDWRYDLLIYGRYTDLFMSAAIILIVIDIMDSKSRIMFTYVFSAILYVIACILTLQNIPDTGNLGNTYVFSIGIHDVLQFATLHLTSLNPLYPVIIKTILGSAVLILGVRYLRKTLFLPTTDNSNSAVKLPRVIFTVLICAFILYNAGSFYYQQKWIRPISGELESEINAIDDIKDSGYADKLNFLIGTYDMVAIDNTQFMIPDQTIRCYSDPELITGLTDEAIVTSLDSIHNPELESRGWSELTHTKNTIVWINKK